MGKKLKRRKAKELEKASVGVADIKRKWRAIGKERTKEANEIVKVRLLQRLAQKKTTEVKHMAIETLHLRRELLHARKMHSKLLEAIVLVRKKEAETRREINKEKKQEGAQFAVVKRALFKEQKMLKEQTAKGTSKFQMERAKESAASALAREAVLRKEFQRSKEDHHKLLKSLRTQKANEEQMLNQLAEDRRRAAALVAVKSAVLQKKNESAHSCKTHEKEDGGFGNGIEGKFKREV